MDKNKIRLGPWLSVGTDVRIRALSVDDVLYVLAVRNDGSGGWVTSVARGPNGRRAYVPGVVNYREAERCASRWARRVVAGLVAA